MNADVEHRVVVTSGCAFTEVGVIGLYSWMQPSVSVRPAVSKLNGTNDVRCRSTVEREDASSQPPGTVCRCSDCDGVRSSATALNAWLRGSLETARRDLSVG